MWPFGACAEQGAELQNRQILSRQDQKQSHISKGNLLQGQGAFCYINKPKLFVLVAVFKGRAVSVSACVKHTKRGSRTPETPETPTLLGTRALTQGCISNSSSWMLWMGPGVPIDPGGGNSKGWSLEGQGHQQGLQTHRESALKIAPNCPKTQTEPQTGTATTGVKDFFYFILFFFLPSA